jgi:hypothetical protein
MKVKLYPVLFFLLLLSDCAESPVTQQDNSIYGPRWIDYEGWGKLELGMSKNVVLETMGEPFMTEEANISGSSKSEILIFKVRAKSYIVRDQFKSTAAQHGAIESAMTKEVNVSVDRKPEKFADINKWGDTFNLYCSFENDKLVRWLCPELIPQTDDTTSANKHAQPK